MSPASNDASMLAVASPAPLHPTVLSVASCTRQHANLLVTGQIVSGLVFLDPLIPEISLVWDLLGHMCWYQHAPVFLEMYLLIFRWADRGDKFVKFVIWTPFEDS
jgi:hypothetical protein